MTCDRKKVGQDFPQCLTFGTYQIDGRRLPVVPGVDSDFFRCERRSKTSTRKQVPLILSLFSIDSESSSLSI